MKNKVARFWRAMGWIFVVIFGVVAGLMVITKNPSKSDSQKHLTVMIEDMDSILKMGGSVDSEYSNAKIGGALLIKNIKSESWSIDLAKAYRLDLMSRGWLEKSTNENFIRLCKDGMLAKINLFPEKDSSLGFPHNIYGFSMVYDMKTIRECH